MPSHNNFGIGKRLSLKIAGLTLPIIIATRKNLSLMSERFGKFLSVPSENQQRNRIARRKAQILWRGNLYNFENSARRWVSVLLAQRKGGLLLHASGIIIKDRNQKSAVLFSGKSSAGKSTIASVFPDDNILSDELVAVIKSKNGYNAYPTPFRGFMPPPKKFSSDNPINTRHNSSRITRTKIYSSSGGAKIKYIFFLVRKNRGIKTL